MTSAGDVAQPRNLEALTVPSGARALEILPALSRALEGDGPALLPVPENENVAARVRTSLGAGEPLDDADDDSTALVIATSGSTGAPKGVRLSWSALRASANATHQHLNGPGRWLLATPGYHIAGIQVLVRSLVAGTAPAAVDTAGGFREEGFLAAADDLFAGSGPYYTALVPTQLARLLDGNNSLAALRRFDAILLGGSAIPPGLLTTAREAGVSVVTTYGMSETAGGCVYDGVPLAGVDVHIGESGNVSLAGPMLASGYRRAPEADAAFADGWFHTGDLGRWRDGRLEILGRADDVIVAGGVNVAPGPIETALAQQETVREACVVGLPDEEWGEAVVAAVVPTDAAHPPRPDTLRAAVRTEFGAAATPKSITVLDELPLRGPGKPDRSAVREALRK